MTTRRLFTAAEFERMAEAGILHPDERLELLEGQLVPLAPQSPLHAAATESLGRLLDRLYGSGFHARRHAPLAAASDSLLQPDLALCEGSIARFARHHPAGTEALLVVELADASPDADRQKATIYARAGVATYWLVDLLRGRVEVRSLPHSSGEYRSTRFLETTDAARLPLAGAAVRIADFLPADPSVA